MRTALGGVLTVNEGIIFFTVRIGVCESQFYIVVLDMNNRVEGGFGGYFVFEQV